MDILKGFEIFKESEIEIITLGVKCKNCGHTWGVKLHGRADLSTFPFTYFMCVDCVRKLNVEPKGEENVLAYGK